MTIQLHGEQSYTVTSIPNIFIDQLMPQANGEFVKVYLYLLRSLSRNESLCTISGIADDLNHTEADVMRALRYWERIGILILDVDNNEICGIHFPDLMSGTSVQVTESPEEPQESEVRRQYTRSEVSAMKDDDSISELFFIVETYLKHPLNSTDTNTILYWLDNLHFPTDLIIYLVESCISSGHSSLRYMDKVAMSWSDKGIDSVEKAKSENITHSKVYNSVMKAFGISGRQLVEVETSFITKWMKEYSFELPIVLEACRRTMSATHQPSFEYADSILTRWHNSHVRSMDDITELDKAHASKARTRKNIPARDNIKLTRFNNFNQREYDYDKLEEMLLTTSVQ